MSARLVGQASRAAATLSMVPRDRIILGILADMANVEHQCWPATGFLVDLSGYTTRSVKRSLKVLVDEGLITRRHRGPTSAMTTLEVSAIEAAAAKFDATRAAERGDTRDTSFTAEGVPSVTPLQDECSDTHATSSDPNEVSPTPPHCDERGVTQGQRGVTQATQEVSPRPPKPSMNHQVKPPPPPQSVGDTQEVLVPEIVEGGRAMTEVGAVLKEIYDRAGYTTVPNRTQQLRDLEVAIDLGHRPADLIEKCTKNLETAGVKASVIATRIRDLAIQKPDLGFGGFTIQGEYDSTLVDLGGPECAHCNDEGQWRNPDLNEYQPCPHCDKGF